MATLDQAFDQMLAAGMPAPASGSIVPDGRFHRYGPKKRCWYKLHEFSTRTGRQFISGTFGYWGLIESMKVERDVAGIDADDLARMQRNQVETEAAERAKRVERARFAANRAAQQWKGARAVLREGETCPYLVKKGVGPDKGLRFLADGTLLVPMLRYDVTTEQEADPQYSGPRRLVGLQKIAPDGSKRFNKGMWKEGAMCRIGGKVKDGEPVLVAEGLATALSIRVALEREHAVFVAFDCYNLKPAAAILRKLYPKSPIFFFADDDHATEGNPGVAMAEKAMQACGAPARVSQPNFHGAERGPKDSDYNDLHALRGIDVLRQQVRQAVEMPLLFGGEPPPSAAAPGGGPGAGEPDWQLHDGLLGRFTLVYPSDTAFDDHIGKLVKVEHMRLMFGKKPIAMWLGSARKRVVLPEQVLFDPSESCDPSTTVNLFRGIRMKPSAEASCDRLISLLRYLCGEEGDENTPISDWVLRWAAYPLQHVGAKMQTAVVMYGEEGTGKNLFWGAVRAIYGDHACLITQMQLQGQFNSWLSAKLFLIANEVVTRHEMRAHVGYLKNLITEPEIYINRKMVDERREENHANMVFLSNELQPLQINPRDRRYMVIRTPGAREEEVYKAVGAEIRAGGAGALYRYLLELELGDFNEHAKPLETQAKRELIELGMPASQLFWQDLHDNVLGLPYVPALATDLYKAYQAWCVRNGEKMPERINRFLPSFMSLNGVRRVDARVPDPDRPLEVADAPEAIRKRRVLIMGEVEPDPEKERLRRVHGIATFRKALKDYLREDLVYMGRSGREEAA